MARPRPKGITVIVPREEVQEIASTTGLQDYLRSVFQILDRQDKTMLGSLSVSEKKE